MSVSLKCFDSVLDKSKALRKEYNNDKRERQPTEDTFFKLFLCFLMCCCYRFTAMPASCHLTLLVASASSELPANQNGAGSGGGAKVE